MPSGRILLVVSEAPPVKSGIARSTNQLQQGMELAGYEVDVISLRDVPRVCAGEVRISSMLWKAPSLLLPRLRQYDIVHIHGPVPTFSEVSLLLAALARRASNPLIVYTHHSEIDLRHLGPVCNVYNWTHKQLARLSDQVIVETPSYGANLGRYVAPDNVVVVPCGVNHGWYDPARPKASRFTVLFVGQLRPYKGLDTLLQAVGDLDDVDVQIVGSGHHAQRYQDLARRLGLRHVTFRGKLSDEQLADAYSAAHVVVLPSNTRAEAFGLVVLEGMVAGCVPVVSQLPGVTDVPGDASLTFPVGDADALRRALVELRDNRELRQRLSQQAQVRAREYTWPRMISRHGALYERLLALRRFNAALSARDPQWATQRLAADALSVLGGRAALVALSDPDGRGQDTLASAGTTAIPDGGESLQVPVSSPEGTFGHITVWGGPGYRHLDGDDYQWLSILGRRAGLALSRHGYIPKANAVQPEPEVQVTTDFVRQEEEPVSGEPWRYSFARA
jgi:glycosyltransferase involved in cell wall biosynthesis